MTQPSVVRAACLPAGTPEVAVAIVGAGACGLTAAVMLGDAGIDCVLLERDARAQGSSALSSGFIPAAGTAVQRAAGVIDDSPGRFAADIQAKAGGSAAPPLVAAYTQAIGPAMDVQQQRHGLGFELLDGFLYPGHGLRRMHALPQRSGAALVAALEAAASRAGAMLVTKALVRKLWCDPQGRVLGLGYRRPDGSTDTLACRALLLACNGFGGNADMVRSLLPEMRGAIFAGHAGNDGSAIAWGRALDAGPADLGGYQGHGAWGRAAGRADHLGADDAGRHPGQCAGPPLPRRDAGLLRGLVAGAGTAGRGHRRSDAANPAGEPAMSPLKQRLAEHRVLLAAATRPARR